MARPIPIDGPIGRRIDAFVTERCRVLEAVSSVRRASLVEEASSASLRTSRDRLLDLSRRELIRVFRPELDQRKGAERRDLLDALDAASQWSVWEHMRSYQGLSPKRAKAIMARTIAALLH